MSKYKAGDKVVMEIIECDDNLLCVSGKSGKRWFLENHVEDFTKPLSEYTEKLEKKNQNKQKRIEKLVEKLHRQADEITRLLAENAELKEKLHEEHHELVWQEGYSYGISDEKEKWNENVKIIRDNAFEAGLIRGQEAAWELSKKMASMKFDEAAECFPDYDRPLGMRSLMNKYSYTEAAAKVAEWERKKEICVGDVVECEGHHGVVVGAGEVYVKGFTSDWTPFQWMKQSCTKTGRHIDIASMLAQIGDER